PASKALEETIRLARVRAYPEVIVCDNPFEHAFREYSADADCIFMGFELPEEDDEKKWHGLYQHLLYKMPTTILVNSQIREIIDA
ncbi:MAG: hypothetical protein KKG53_13755, partial [Proteobacteria bacterium]|nr:hypothetical protein [Pseudomonadota bacterium]